MTILLEVRISIFIFKIRDEKFVLWYLCDVYSYNRMMMLTFLFWKK